MNNNPILSIAFVIAIFFNLNLAAQFTKKYTFSTDSVHVFNTPTPINSYYLPYDISNLKKPMYAEPFTNDVAFPNVAQNIYGPAGNVSGTFFGGESPEGFGYGFTASTVIINEIFSNTDFPIVLEADFFNRSSYGSFNESYFWIGNSNYTHFNPSTSVLPTPNVQQGIIIGGSPARTLISNGGTFLKTPVRLYDNLHNLTEFDEWNTMKTILDILDDGSLVIYNVVLNDKCILPEPIIVLKSEDLNLNSFRLAICVDDFAKEFKMTKNALLFQLPNIVACENEIIDLNADFDDKLCLDLSYQWSLPGSNIGTSNLKSPTNLRYANPGTYPVTLTISNGQFKKTLTFSIKINDELSQTITQNLCPNDSIYFNNQWIYKSGIYQQTLSGQSGCDSITILNLTFSDEIKTSLDFLLCSGDTIKVGQEVYTRPGNFVQNLNSSLGCDSTLLINIKLLNEDLLYDFNKCSATVGSTNMDYSEFTSAFSQISCGKISFSNINRSNPSENKHSCTPGLANSLAMCVGSSSDCTYSAGNNKSVVFSFEVTPEEGKYFQIAKLKFFEKSPLMYDWINGASGINNYPTKFGFRVLKNGVEIYKVEEINSKRDWNEHKIAFMNNEAFIAKEKSTYQFEFLPYCPFGNSSSISAWDLENISIFTACIDKENRILTGVVTDAEGNPFDNVNVLKQHRLQIENVFTDKNGNYTFNDIVNSDECEISVLKNDDFLYGISTLDLILIQRHILGIETFNTSDKYVAADVNNDTRISASDLLELRKLILGINESFSNNKSWRFCSELPSFTPSSKVIINEKFRVEHGKSDIKNLNFTGIKIGDINNDSNFNNQVENRKYNNFELNYTLNKKLGNEYELEIYANNIDPLIGLQIAIDIQNFEFVKILSSQLNIEPINYNLKHNNFYFSYSSPNLINIDKSKPIFKIILKSDAISPSFNGLSSNLKNEVYGSDLIPKNIFLRPLEKAKFFESISVSPNPFDHQTNLEYFSSEPQETNIQIFNTSGKLLISEKFHSTFGLNNVKITSTQFGDLSGLYFVKLFTKNESHVIKLVVK